MTTALFAMLSRGTHVVVTDDSYRRTRQFLNQTLHRYGIEVSTVPAGDYEALEDAIRPTTRVLLSESPTNPYNRVLDLERFAAIGREHRVKTVIDATFATPVQPAAAGVGRGPRHALGHEVPRRPQRPPGRRGARLARAGGRASAGCRASPAPSSIPSPPICSCAGSRRSRCAWSGRTPTRRPSRSSSPRTRASRPCTTPGCPAIREHDVAKRQMRGFGGVVSFEVQRRPRRGRARGRRVHASRTSRCRWAGWRASSSSPRS